MMVLHVQSCCPVWADAAAVAIIPNLRPEAGIITVPGTLSPGGRQSNLLEVVMDVGVRHVAPPLVVWLAWPLFCCLYVCVVDITR